MFLIRNILMDGHMAVYGIYFDTDKYHIKTEATETLKKIASLSPEAHRLINL